MPPLAVPSLLAVHFGHILAKFVGNPKRNLGRKHEKGESEKLAVGRNQAHTVYTCSLWRAISFEKAHAPFSMQPRRGPLGQLSEAQLNAERHLGGTTKPTAPFARLSTALRPGGKLGEGAMRASLSTWRASSHGGSGVGTRVRPGLSI